LRCTKHQYEKTTYTFNEPLSLIYAALVTKKKHHHTTETGDVCVFGHMQDFIAKIPSILNHDNAIFPSFIKSGFYLTPKCNGFNK